MLNKIDIKVGARIRALRTIIDLKKGTEYIIIKSDGYIENSFDYREVGKEHKADNFSFTTPMYLELFEIVSPRINNWKERIT